ncbi:N-formylglutamate amidohydrolase [Roseimaritima sediminicola]|uniref:N-formylglutamate amidohydrolase n=1 Tax=Roseimaritima sediminicola TaxID=2662066 RepID=UPI0012984663|nr:N-formylglutamate amidohydrolase [Roseimaritima sediminicola]
MTRIDSQLGTTCILSCEHGGCEVPDELSDCFATAGAARALRSHRGYDPGALTVARALAAYLACPLWLSTVSRLVVDLNRSKDSPELFSRFTGSCAAARRQHILQTYYRPYRRRVTSAIRRRAANGGVLHLSIHTFTPRYRGTQRRFDVGVLFDPDRPWERQLATRLLDQLNRAGLHAVANRPYHGCDDGLTTTLRGRFDDTRYAGIELEINNRFARLATTTQRSWCERIGRAVSDAAALPVQQPRSGDMR